MIDHLDEPRRRSARRSPRPLPLLALLCALLVGAGCSRPVPELPVTPDRLEAWPEDVVREMASLPMQDNGRIKPLSVYAAFTLYFVHGRRDVKFSALGTNGEQQKVTLDPTEWVLDVMCYPQQASHYPLFRVEHAGVLDAIGVENDGQRQDFDYLSYMQVLDHVKKLEELANRYGAIEAKDRNLVQEHVWQLWLKFLRYDRLNRQFGALHHTVTVQDEALVELFGGERVSLGQMMAKAEGLRAMMAALDPQLENASPDLIAVLQFLNRVVDNDSDGAGLFAPLALDPKAITDDPAEWWALGRASQGVLQGHRAHLQPALAALGEAARAPSTAQAADALRTFRREAGAAAEPYCDLGTVELEKDYYAASWHYRSIHWFLFAFVLAAVSWLTPRGKLFWWASMGVTALALGMLSYDVVLRCLITERPPIKNLYDTFLFIAAVGVLVAMITEFVLPRRIALAVAPFFGALIVMFARLFELSDGKDTMDPLVAVLDSNFWLATHVTTINIGYAAGLIAALLGAAWIALRALRIYHPTGSEMKALVRMTYGVTCFGLTFAVVGTILGGVWANDSWGRFWGWDPKENGALMICLAQVALLHARMSGWVRDFGFVAWSVVTGMVVVFSWFHVNLFQTGLHSYGFSAGLHNAVWISYLVLGLFVVVGFADTRLWPDAVVRRRTIAGADGATEPTPATAS